MTRRTSTPTSQSAAERLDAVRAEIASLEAPLPGAPADADIDALTAKVADRSARRQALLLTVPALERAVLVERLDEVGSTINELVDIRDRTAAIAHEVQEREQKLIAERVEAVGIAVNAQADVEWWIHERDLVVEALRRHDETHAAATESEGTS